MSIKPGEREYENIPASHEAESDEESKSASKIRYQCREWIS